MADALIGFFIMRKDDPITYAEFTADGNMVSFSKDIMNKDLAPLQDMYQGQWLNLWWKERSIPIEQDNIRMFLQENGYSMPSDYLIRNLGLSLTDYYWLKPINSDLTWKDVNLFDNNFKSNLLNWRNDISESSRDDIPHYSPNGSLQGTIEKSWVINNGDRCLIKGNHTFKSIESINETIACEIHRRQNWLNYCDYHLIEIANKNYAYGCYSKAFTSQERELVSAWALFTNEKKSNNVSNFTHLLNMCKKFGMDPEIIRMGLEYQILVDFIMSGYDRHLNNIAFIRDASSLKFLGLAPIFDSGGAMFAGKEIPKNEKELFELETNSFVKRETDLVALVQNKGLIDLTKLPDSRFIRESYVQDPKMEAKEINNIAHWYEKKIDMCRDLQLGRDAFKKQVAFGSVVSPVEKASVTREMEAVWHAYFSKPKKQRTGIKWNGTTYRPAVFDDIYLAQCIKDNVSPDKEIYEHFWQLCVGIQEYEPKFCYPDHNISL